MIKMWLNWSDCYISIGNVLCLQHDGKAAGDEEDERTKEEISERKKREHDQLIMARIRGNEALKQEKLKHVSLNIRIKLYFKSKHSQTYNTSFSLSAKSVGGGSMKTSVEQFNLYLDCQRSPLCALPCV